MVKATRKNESYCINDPDNKKTCILDDPNLCKFEFYSACLEAHPDKAGKKPEALAPLDIPRNTYKSKHSQPFYDDEPLDNPTTSPPDQQKEEEGAIPTIPIELVGINNSPSPAPPAPETDRPAVIITPYDVNDGIIENVFTIELATACLKDLIQNETKNSKSLAQALLQVKEKFFSENGKKKGWKVYIEKEINFTYRQAQNLMKGYMNPIILEFWDDLGIGKISLLNRYKDPITSELINEIVPITHREAKTFLFPPCTQSKQKASKLDTLINSLKNLKPSELAPQARNKLKLVLQETIRQLK